MRVLYTGATGVIGRQGIPHLLAVGHDVTAIARSNEDRRWLTELGALPIDLDLFDPSAVARAVDGVDAIVHMATAIPPQDKMTKRDSWEMNDQLRTHATRILVDAALRHGVPRFVQQSVSLVYGDNQDRWIGEDSPIEPVWAVLDSALNAERNVDYFTRQGGLGVNLRFSNLYGPGKTSADYIASVAARKLPIIGRGDNYVAHLHIADTATAIAAALTAPAGTYNVSDDTPVTKRNELNTLATAINARAPRSIPRWIAKSVVGPAAGLLTISHRVSNARFKDTTGWEPTFPSVLEGWDHVIATPTTNEQGLHEDRSRHGDRQNTTQLGAAR